MNPSDKKNFKQMMDDVAALYGKDKYTPSALRLWWAMLDRYPFNIVEAAIMHHMKHDKFIPKPADVIGLVAASDGRPTADEAWAIALSQNDESLTVSWTDEISAALSMGAQAILSDGDKIAARMAFRDSYNRLVDQARDSGIPARWSMSLGHDVTMRGSEIAKARDMGRISNDKAKLLLSVETTAQGSELLALAHDTVKAVTPEEKTKNRDRINKLRETLSVN